MMVSKYYSPLLLALAISSLICGCYANKSNYGTSSFPFREATVDQLQNALRQRQLTSRQITQFYLNEINRLNPLLRAVIEVNPDALSQADRADQERNSNRHASSFNNLHGIPILLKDNIATRDRLNTTAGSFALLGSVVSRDAVVVQKLRRAGAIILGKASMTEWSSFRSDYLPHGFCGRSGQGKNPYVLSATPCGSSSGNGIAVAANLAAVSLATETSGSILCPASATSVVGIRPTVGLTSRTGVIPISFRQDTVGPMCRTVRDAVYVLDAIVGSDNYDPATRGASRFIPRGGYRQFLNPDGLRGKRLGIVRNPFFRLGNDQGSVVSLTFKRHLNTLRQRGAILVDNLQIANINAIINKDQSGELHALLAEFRPAINKYLQQLVKSPVRSLADVIAFNNRFSNLEKTREYRQELFEFSESLSGPAGDRLLKTIVPHLNQLSRNGMENLVRTHNLDAIVSPFDPQRSSDFSTLLSIGGYPGITVPAGYDNRDVPFGICFGGVQGTEPKLIQIAYGFEQATKVRRAPSFRN